MFFNHPSLSRCPYDNVAEGRVKYTGETIEGEDADLPITIGFEGTGFPTMIRSILLQDEQFEYDEDAVY